MRLSDVFAKDSAALRCNCVRKFGTVFVQHMLRQARAEDNRGKPKNEFGIRCGSLRLRSEILANHDCAKCPPFAREGAT